MNPPTNCLECGTPLHAADAGGLCPKCLLRLGLASQLATGTLPASAVGLTPDGVVIEPFDFGGYRILRLLGKGGMGAVYEAEQRSTGRVVALKVLGQTLDTPEMRQRFIREGQLAAAVRHPNTVTVLSAEEVDGAPVIAMELVGKGTLRDRVKANGPLPIAVAVDAILQIIDGLEAAHAGGVLHRDVKPANCFCAEDGTVKVGDFGLSISTLIKAEQQLTQPGSVLGTPAFASPEQLRAQEIDVRSDIYSVGATLYFLVTGKPTHDAETLVALIASVLERDPVNPQRLRPDLPDALARVILRCLARNPAARFASYRELRSALAPFRSATAIAATPARRLLAGIIDGVVISLPVILLLSEGRLDPASEFIVHRTWNAGLLIVLLVLWEIAVVSLPEARWGAGLGKALCGLRVLKLNGDVPGNSRALARWGILTMPTVVQSCLVVLLNPTTASRERILRSDSFMWEECVSFLLLALLFATMRRGNGYTAVHDLLTATRVVNAPPPIEGTPLPCPSQGTPSPACERIGAYAVIEKLRNDLVLAYDESLKRHLWVQIVPTGTPPVSAARRDLGRAGRLRWLAGVRGTGENWDAYEAPAGRPLAELFNQLQPWALVRIWLYHLAEELRVGLDTETLPINFAIDRLWLSADGRVVVLDFPAPGAIHSEPRHVRDQSEAQRFLSDVARAVVGPRMPLRARELLGTLRLGAFDSMAFVAGNLHASIERPAEVSVRRRLISVAAPVLLVLCMALFGLRWEGVQRERFERAWATAYSDRPSPWDLVALYETAEYPLRAACLTAIAARYGDTASNEKFWRQVVDRSNTAERIKSVIQMTVDALPNVSMAEAEKAEEKFKPAFEDYRRSRFIARLVQLASVIAGFLTAGAVFGIAWSLLTVAPPLFCMNDIAIVGSDGQVASRARVVGRMLVAWSPVFVAFAPVFATSLVSYDEQFTGLAIMSVALFMAACGAIWAVLHPARSLQDQIAGTWLVPR